MMNRLPPHGERGLSRPQVVPVRPDVQRLAPPRWERVDEPERAPAEDGQALTLADFDRRLLAVEDALTARPKSYQFKIAPEILWAAGTAAGTVLLQSLTDVEKIADYRAWLVGLGAALIRAVIGALLSKTKPPPAA